MGLLSHVSNASDRHVIKPEYHTGEGEVYVEIAATTDTKHAPAPHHAPNGVWWCLLSLSHSYLSPKQMRIIAKRIWKWCDELEGCVSAPLGGDDAVG